MAWWSWWLDPRAHRLVQLVTASGHRGCWARDTQQRQRDPNIRISVLLYSVFNALLFRCSDSPHCTGLSPQIRKCGGRGHLRPSLHKEPPNLHHVRLTQECWRVPAEAKPRRGTDPAFSPAPQNHARDHSQRGQQDTWAIPVHSQTAQCRGEPCPLLAPTCLYQPLLTFGCWEARGMLGSRCGWTRGAPQVDLNPPLALMGQPHTRWGPVSVSEGCT